MWVYINSEPGLFTVGFYSPDGRWHGDSDHDSRDKAATRVHWLNGGGDKNVAKAMVNKLIDTTAYLIGKRRLSPKDAKFIIDIFKTI
ncbi:MAG: hypothetical protein ABSG01_08995 [Anaerolineales bacterium]|jgi:hypothetical protein